jgi:dynactin complex subunit
MEGVLQLDDAVLLSTGIGIVRYVGKIAGAKGQWLGLELTDGCVGNSDGMMKGKRYFKCEANKGMFILAKEIQRKLSPEELIQKIIHLSEALSRARQQRQNNLRSMATAGEKQRMQEDMITRLKKVNECISSHPQPFQIRHISKHMPSDAEVAQVITTLSTD